MEKTNKNPPNHHHQIKEHEHQIHKTPKIKTSKSTLERVKEQV